MSLARLQEQGSGSLAVRLVFEGLPIEIVSDPAMEKTTSDGRRRVYAMNLEECGITINEKVNIPDAMLEGMAFTATMFETKDEALSQVFARRPSREWWVSATVATADAVVLLLSTDGIAVDDVVHLGTEAMLVTGVGAGVIAVTREHWQTIAQKHWSNTASVGYRKLADAPERIRGRRAYLYLYSDGDDLQGDGGNGGEPVWRGTVASEPRLMQAGLEWELSIDSIDGRLKSTVGGELDASLALRGAYYPWAAGIFVRIIEDQTGGAIEMGASTFHGFYETLADFCSAFTAWITARATARGLASTYRVEPTEDGRWTIRAVVGTDVTAIHWFVRSYSDATSTMEGGHTVTTGTIVTPEWLDTASTDSRRFPCTYFGDPRNPAMADPSLAATYPSTRLHLSADLASDVDTITIEWDDGAHAYQVTDRDTGNNSIDLRNDRNRPGSGEPGYHNARMSAVEAPPMRPTRRIAGGDLADLRDALVANAPIYCNRATWPFVTDVDLADWTDAVALAVRERWQRSRIWALGKPVELDELLSAEMRLLAVFPILTSDGRIGLSSLALPTSTDGVTVLDDELISVQWSTLERGNQTINQVVVRTYYDPAEDEHRANITIRDEDSYASDHQPRTLEIAPKSYASHGDVTIDAESVASAVYPTIAIYGYAHTFVTVAVDWRYFSAHLGSYVRFSAIHLPDFASGQRPMSDVLGIVVERRWELGEAHGTLRLLLPGYVPRGYAPTAVVDDQTNVTDDTWDLTLINRVYGPSGTLDVEFFEVTDAIRIVEYDTESPTVVTGTVTEIDIPNLRMRVDLGGTWTPGSATWHVKFGNYANCTDSQKARYAFIADGGASLDGDRAHTYGP